MIAYREEAIRHCLVARIPGSHPGGPGSIPGVGNPFLNADNLLLGFHGCSNQSKMVDFGCQPKL